MIKTLAIRLRRDGATPKLQVLLGKGMPPSDCQSKAWVNQLSLDLGPTRRQNAETLFKDVNPTRDGKSVFATIQLLNAAAAVNNIASDQEVSAFSGDWSSE